MYSARWKGLGLAGAVAFGVVGCAPPALELRIDSVHLVVHTEGDATVPADVREKLTALRHCFGVADASRREASLELTVTFRTNGRVKRIASVKQVQVSTNMPPGMRRCIRDKVARWLLVRILKPTLYGPFVVRFTPGPSSR